jgi:CRISPR-associated exonuclease Cas4
MSGNYFDENDLQPISALQHLIFCPRQWALIHLEQVWMENVLTVEGKQMHEKVDEPDCERRPGIRIARALRLRSLRFGITGVADVVEFHEDAFGHVLNVVPVEYKRGKPKIDLCDEVQLCGQVFCLEEMLSLKIDKGFIFYGQPRRRHEVMMDGILREETSKTIHLLHSMFAEGKTPPPVYDKKCNNCSLYEQCMPKTFTASSSVTEYLNSFYIDLPS